MRQDKISKAAFHLLSVKANPGRGYTLTVESQMTPLGLITQFIALLSLCTFNSMTGIHYSPNQSINQLINKLDFASLCQYQRQEQRTWGLIYSGRPLEWRAVDGKVADVAQQDDPQRKATVCGDLVTAMCRLTAGLQRAHRPCDFNVTSLPQSHSTPHCRPSTGHMATLRQAQLAQVLFPDTKVWPWCGQPRRGGGVFGVKGWRPLWWNLTLQVTWSHGSCKHQEERERRMGLWKWSKGRNPVNSGQRGLGTATMATNDRFDYCNYVQIMCMDAFFFYFFQLTDESAVW